MENPQGLVVIPDGVAPGVTGSDRSPIKDRKQRASHQYMQVMHASVGMNHRVVRQAVFRSVHLLSPPCGRRHRYTNHESTLRSFKQPLPALRPHRRPHPRWPRRRWRYWNRWFSSDKTKASPTSLVSATTADSYTRLVLRNPKTRGKTGGGESARGGSFVYIAVPGALGTDEAHAITVALRGAPPSFPVTAKGKTGYGEDGAGKPAENDVFTVYVKDLGPWTKALRTTAMGAEATGNAASLLVDVDGFYTQTQSLTAMKVADGAPRVVIVAGGSGMTSLMGFIQVRGVCFVTEETQSCGNGLPKCVESNPPNGQIPDRKFE